MIDKITSEFWDATRSIENGYVSVSLYAPDIELSSVVLDGQFSEQELELILAEFRHAKEKLLHNKCNP